jgi:hypothetical protein
LFNIFLIFKDRNQAFPQYYGKDVADRTLRHPSYRARGAAFYKDGEVGASYGNVQPWSAAAMLISTTIGEEAAYHRLAH